jgi:hypothetical protein
MREHKAYQAMVHFLEERYKQLPSDDLGALLGDLSLDIWDDGTPGDPALAAQWERALSLAEEDMREFEKQSPVFRKVS